MQYHNLHCPVFFFLSFPMNVKLDRASKVNSVLLSTCSNGGYAPINGGIDLNPMETQYLWSLCCIVSLLLRGVFLMQHHVCILRVWL